MNKKFKLQTGNVIKEIEAPDMTIALGKFLRSLKANQFGILTMVEYIDEYGNTTCKTTPTEIALQRLGLSSKFKKELEAWRKQKTTSRQDVQDYNEI